MSTRLADAVGTALESLIYLSIFIPCCWAIVLCFALAFGGAQ